MVSETTQGKWSKRQMTRWQSASKKHEEKFLGNHILSLTLCQWQMHFKSNLVEEYGLSAAFHSSYLLQGKSQLPLNLGVEPHSELLGIYFLHI